MDDKLKYLRNYSGKTSNGSNNEPTTTTHTPKLPKQQGPRPPVVHLDDDDHDSDKPAFERHIKFLQKEYKKLRPDQYVVKELMRKTFKIRREQIQEAPTRVSDLLEIYPALKNYDHVSTCVNKVVITVCMHIIATC